MSIFDPSLLTLGCYGVSADDISEQWSCDRCTEGNFTAVRQFYTFDSSMTVVYKENSSAILKF